MNPNNKGISAKTFWTLIMILLSLIVGAFAYSFDTAKRQYDMATSDDITALRLEMREEFKCLREEIRETRQCQNLSQQFIK